MRKHVISGITAAFLIAALSRVGACERITNWAAGKKDVSSFVATLDAADRIVIRSTHDDQFRQETKQAGDRAAVLELVRKYPSDWQAVISGTAGDYNLDFYRGDQELGTVGLTSSDRFPGQDTVVVDGAARQIPKEDVARLTGRLGLTWPIARR